MVRRLVQQKQVRLLRQGFGDGGAATFTPAGPLGRGRHVDA